MAKNPVAPPALEKPVTQKEFDRWAQLKEMIAPLAEEEMKLRRRIFATYFPDPKEGVNDLPMGGDGGYVLKGTYKIERKLIVEQYTNLAQEFREAKLPLKDLVVSKLSLSVAEYKKLTEEQQALFDKALEIKPGAPTLEVVKPKRA
jgi:hypothetical protein